MARRKERRGKAVPPAHNPGGVLASGCPAKKCKQGLWPVLVLFAISACAFLAILRLDLSFLQGPRGPILVEPDSFMRWRLVERALSGEGVRIRHMDEDNAPRGRLNEWTSPMTLVGVCAVKVAGVFPKEGKAEALKTGALWIGPIFGLLALAAMGWSGWRIGGWPLSAGIAVLWPALEDVERVFRFNYMDYHGFHLLLCAVAFGGLMALRERSAWRWGVGLGAVCALMTWSAATESLLLTLPLFLLSCYETATPARLPEDTKLFWRAWWGSGMAFTTAAWLFEFWPRLFHGRLEFLSVWNVGLWIIAGVTVEVLSRHRFRLAEAAAVLGGALLLSVLTAGALKGFAWGRLHILQDPRFARQAGLTLEFQSYLAEPDTSAPEILWNAFGLLPLGLVLGGFMLRRLSPRERFIWVCALALCALALWQKRFALAALPPLVLATGVSLHALWPRRTWCVAAAMALVAFGPWISLAHYTKLTLDQGGDPHKGPYVEEHALMEAAECMGEDGDRPVVLAAGDWGAELAGTGLVRVIGSQYWSNLEGMEAGFEAYRTNDSDELKKILKERGVRYLLVPDPDTLGGRSIMRCMRARGSGP